MRRIAVVNVKGGCGKTTTAINLAGQFAASGRRTLLVDLDPQSHCAAGLAIPEQRLEMDVGDAMLSCERSSFDPERLLWRVTRNLDLAPSRAKLALLGAGRRTSDESAGSWLLDTLLTKLSARYDACVIDTPPAMGLLTRNAIAAATRIVMPVETSYFSLLGVQSQAAQVGTILQSLGLATPITVVPTNHDAAVALAVDLLAELRRSLGDRVAPMEVPADVRVKEAASFGQPVCQYAPESPAAESIRRLAEWIEGHATGMGRGAQAPGRTSERPAPRSAAPVSAGRDEQARRSSSRAEDLANRARALRERREMGVADCVSD